MARGHHIADRQDGAFMITVCLADDEPLVRSGLRAILSAQPDIEVVGEASDGAEIVSLVNWVHPRVVCMDVRMPSVDGIRATELLLSRPDPPQVLVVTTFENDDYVYDALRVGAAGFLLKRARAEEIVAAVRTVAAGDSLVFPDAIRRLVAQRASPSATTVDYGLTPRENEVVRLLARGLTNAEIAEQLALGVETVKTHVANVLSKLGARDRTQAVVIAYETGLVPLRG